MIIAGSHIESDNNEIYWSQQDYLLRLLDHSSFAGSDKKYLLLREEIEQGMDMIRYVELEAILLANIIDPISAGRNYNMEDITKKINREI